VIEIRAIGPDDWRTWRDLRLAALADAPDAFGSRLADWQDATEQRWRDRLAAADTNLVAYLDDAPAGMASGVRSDDDPAVAVLISMYVASAARGHGLGDRLVTAIAGWARTTGATALHLDVKTGNEPAAALYRRNGFTVSDLPAADPTEITMVRSLTEPARR
jgi:GNAT superfamily N-acetyltransferase